MKNLAPWRKIVRRDYYRTDSHPNNAADSVLLYLECEHVTHRKGSTEPKGNRVRCKVCRGDIPF